MKKKKTNTIITIIIILLIALTIGIVTLLNYSKDESSLTILEKKWITDNTNKVVDINIYNDIPVYSYNGSGIIFDYLDYFTNKYDINFNKISSYNIEDIKNKDLVFLSLSNEEELTKNGIKSKIKQPKFTNKTE